MTVSNPQDQGGKTSLLSDPAPAQIQQTKQQFDQSQHYLSFELGKAVQSLPTMILRLVAGTITLAVVAGITWAAVSEKEQLARADGQTVLSEKIQPIRAPISGDIDTLVTPSQTVEKGEVLLELKTKHIKVEIRQINQKLNRIQANIRQIYRNRVAAQKSQVRQLSAEKKSLEKQLQMVKDELYWYPKPEAIGFPAPHHPKWQTLLTRETELTGLIVSKQQELEQVPLRDYPGKSGSLSQVEELEREKIELRRQRQQLKHQLEQSTIKAPVAGKVFNLKITRGAANVQQGQELFSIVPVGEPLMMAVKVASKDAAHIRPDMPVKVKLTSYDYQEYETLPGIVQRISPDSVSKEGEQPYFNALIALQKDTVIGKGQTHQLQPGLAGTAEMVLGKKTVLKILLDPITASFDESLSF